jgi:hypothetical protein
MAFVIYIYSKTPFYCPLIHRQTRIPPWNYQVPFSFHVKTLVIMPSSHIAIHPGVKRSNDQFTVDLSLDIMPISYVTFQWFYRCLLFLQVGLQAIKVNWSSCINNLISVNCYIIKSWNHSVSFIVCDLF